MVTTATIEAKTVAEAVEKVNEIHKEFGANVDIDLEIFADDEAEAPKLLGAVTNATGAIQFENFTGLTSLPQKAASAASAIETAGLVGASYQPIFYVGTQVAGGTNYWFFALQTLTTHPIKKQIVKLAVNELNGKFKIARNTIKAVIA